jgi:hypothetical protein
MAHGKKTKMERSYQPLGIHASMSSGMVMVTARLTRADGS